MHRNDCVVLLAGVLLACTGDDSPSATSFVESGTTGLQTSDSSSTSSSTTTTTTTTDAETTTGAAETSVDTTEEDTGPEGWTPYEDCVMGQCPEEADECRTYVAHVAVQYCTVHCENASECPEAPGGTAVPQCDPFFNYGYCALDCSEGKGCPQGMGCYEVTLVNEDIVMRCGWVDR